MTQTIVYQMASGLISGLPSPQLAMRHQTICRQYRSRR